MQSRSEGGKVAPRERRSDAGQGAAQSVAREDDGGMKIGVLGRPPQLPSRVAAAISSEIMEGRLKAGSRLPTEQALSQRFGVSRSVVREALARLRSEGIVQSRQGVGVFVVESEETTTLRIDADLLSDRVVFQNVFELRAILEIRAAALAAIRADETQRRAMSEAIERMRSATSWVAEGVAADLEFHRAVAAGSGNPYMAMMVAYLSGQMRQSIMFMRANQRDADGTMVATNVAEHTAIHAAIMARAPSEAAEAMRHHITSAARRLGYDVAEAALREEADPPRQATAPKKAATTAPRRKAPRRAS